MTTLPCTSPSMTSGRNKIPSLQSHNHTFIHSHNHTTARTYKYTRTRSHEYTNTHSRYHTNLHSYQYTHHQNTSYIHNFMRPPLYMNYIFHHPPPCLFHSHPKTLIFPYKHYFTQSYFPTFILLCVLTFVCSFISSCFRVLLVVYVVMWIVICLGSHVYK